MSIMKTLGFNVMFWVLHPFLDEAVKSRYLALEGAPAATADDRKVKKSSKLHGFTTKGLVIKDAIVVDQRSA